MGRQYGYTGRILQVDLATGKISHLSTADYSDRFLGGRGIAAKLYWDIASPEVQAFDPANPLIIVTGPLAGIPGIAGSRWEVCSKSAAMTPQHFSYCNLGGSWGAHLKFAGYDGLVVTDRSDKPVYLSIENDSVAIRDAAYLWGRDTIETRNILKRELGLTAKVLAIGPAGENRVVYASLLADGDASGSSGMGAVMGAKNLKAVVVRGSRRVEVAAPEKLQEITRFLRELKQNQPWFIAGFVTGIPTRKTACWGCIKGCARGIYTTKDGWSGKFYCQSGNFYKRLARSYYKEKYDDIAFKADHLCDRYGLDATVVEGITRWLLRCYQAGIVTDAGTGLPVSRIGSMEFIESLVHKLSSRQDFGEWLAEGLAKAAGQLGKGAAELLEGQVSPAGEQMQYEPRLYITTALLWAMEPRRTIQQLHAVTKLTGQWQILQTTGRGIMTSELLHRIGEKFFGSEAAFDFSTYAGKALAVKKLQDREYAIESLILCDCIYPITEREETADHLGDPSLESRILSAVTGKSVDEAGLCHIGERVWNMQRAVRLREGHRGKEDDTLPEFNFSVPIASAADNPDCIVAGSGSAVISRKGAVVDRQQFAEMRDEYYRLRHWDVATGLPIKAGLGELGLQEIIPEMERNGLISYADRNPPSTGISAP